MTIGGGYLALVEELQREYPIGNNPQFPHKRVYTSEGRSWKLNNIRLQLWAQKMVRIHAISQFQILNSSRWVIHLRQPFIPLLIAPTFLNLKGYVLQQMCLNRLQPFLQDRHQLLLLQSIIKACPMATHRLFLSSTLRHHTHIHCIPTTPQLLHLLALIQPLVLPQHRQQKLLYHVLFLLLSSANDTTLMTKTKVALQNSNSCLETIVLIS